MQNALARTALAVMVIVSLASAWALAQNATVPSGAAVFIEEMENDLDGYLRAEFVKKKLPLSVVLSRQDAHLVLTGASTAEANRKWHEGWLTSEQDRTSGNVMVFDRATKKLLWAGEAGDRSLWWGSLARGGQRKVADRLASNLKKAIRVQATALPAPPPLAPEEIAATLATPPAPGAPPTRSTEGPRALGNEDIVTLVKGGMSDDLVIATIQQSTTAFTLNPDTMLELKNQGVSEKVIAAMLNSKPR
jgi:hypothetical protein